MSDITRQIMTKDDVLRPLRGGIKRTEDRLALFGVTA